MLSIVIRVDGDKTIAGKDMRDVNIKEMCLAIAQLEITKKYFIDSIEKTMEKKSDGHP